MQPLVPRMHLFEIDDQPWFPSFLRARVQSALTAAWNTRIPVLQSASPAQHVAGLLKTHVLASASDYAFVDFCAGGGGPTPRIEREVNKWRRSLSGSNGSSSSSSDSGNGDEEQPIPFVLTDLHPHVPDWSKAAANSPNISYEASPVDASAAPASLLQRVRSLNSSSDSNGGDKNGVTNKKSKKSKNQQPQRKLFRIFNLAFHHFDDPLATKILKNTVETSDGFGIFELQDRSFAAFVTTTLFGVAALLGTPFFAFATGDLAVLLIFTYLIPIIPFVLTFDGWISSLRTRTPEEVEHLLKNCGAKGVENWEIRSGSIMHLWPCGYLNWVICTKKQ